MRKLLYVLLLIFNANILNLQSSDLATNSNNKVEITINTTVDSVLSKEICLIKKKPITIFFELRIDSLGVIHSAHIVKTENLKPNFDIIFNICKSLENSVKVKHLYDHWKRYIDKKILLDEINCMRITYKYVGNIQ